MLKILHSQNDISNKKKCLFVLLIMFFCQFALKVYEMSIFAILFFYLSAFSLKLLSNKQCVKNGK